MAEPQVCSTEVMAILAPKCFGSAAIVVSVPAEALNRRIVDHGLVGVSDIGDLRRQREHDMEVWHGQQLGFPVFQPFACGSALTLRAMAVAATVVSDCCVTARAVLAPLNVATKRCRAAGLDGAHHLQLAKAHVTAVGITPRGAVIAKDIRDLQRRTAHE